MIGILCNENEEQIVHEFFELFKTPWEFFDSSVFYDVVISTHGAVTDVRASLLIIYSSNETPFDEVENLKSRSIKTRRLGDHRGISLPVYGEILSFQDQTAPVIYSEPEAEVVAIEIFQDQRKIVRAGFDLFKEVELLLSVGQPVENAASPTIDAHISILRSWILSIGIPLVEIPPSPFGYNFFISLTHDIDFVGIRHHKFDHTMWGFLYRGLVGSLLSFISGRIGVNILKKNWMAVLKLPLVFTGLVDDFWAHFEKYADVDNGEGSTFFIIPFKNQAGDSLDVKNPDHSKRAAPYGINDIQNKVKFLSGMGFEIGLHGIDAWQSVDKGAKELDQINAITDEKVTGVRMHWLYYNHNSPLNLDRLGFQYDASLGYNQAVGFKNGTTQVFRPIGVTNLLEIPLNIQDTSLFYPRRLALQDDDAKQLCEELLNLADQYGGVLTLSWHDRSLVPERNWGEFYSWLLHKVKVRGAWIGSAGRIVKWFLRRRLVKFIESGVVDNKFRVKLSAERLATDPPMILRFYVPDKSTSKQAPGSQYQIIDLRVNGIELVEIPLKNSEVN